MCKLKPDSFSSSSSGLGVTPRSHTEDIGYGRQLMKVLFKNSGTVQWGLNLKLLNVYSIPYFGSILATQVATKYLFRLASCVPIHKSEEYPFNDTAICTTVCHTSVQCLSECKSQYSKIAHGLSHTYISAVSISV